MKSRQHKYRVVKIRCVNNQLLWNRGDIIPECTYREKKGTYNRGNIIPEWGMQNFKYRK